MSLTILLKQPFPVFNIHGLEEEVPIQFEQDVTDFHFVTSRLQMSKYSSDEI